MDIVVTPEAKRLVRERGGMLFVRMRRFGRAGCGITMLETTTDPPPEALEWRRIRTKDFLLFVPRRMPLPRELHVDVAGRFRRRVEAFWNGCAYVL